SVMQVFAADAGRVKVKLMSEFNTNDLVGNHVVYLAYLSGLEGLRDLVFAASGLATGLTFDELVNIDSGERYQSSSGLSTGDSGYRDYGLLRTFPTTNGAQYLFLAGMRDEGLVNLAESLTKTPQLPALEALAVGADGEAAFEALYEVRGFNHTNFEATLVYASALDTRVVWQNRLLGNVPCVRVCSALYCRPFYTRTRLEFSMGNEINYKSNPLHGVSLKTVLTELVDHYGFEILYAYLYNNCFKTNPSIASSVKFLNKTDWARE